MNIIRKSALLFALALSTTAMAVPVTFNKAVGLNDDGVYGTSRIEDYNVAIRFDGSFKGKKIVSVTLPLAGTSGLTNPQAFLTKRLAVAKVDNKIKNSADIETVEARFEGNNLVATFSTPCTVDDDGVYVGCSFTVESATDTSYKPLVGKNVSSKDGFYYVTSKSQMMWLDASADYHFTLDMTVAVDGDYAANDLQFLQPEDKYAGKGTTFTMPVTIVNRGGSVLESFDYSYTINGVSKTGSWENDAPAQLCYDEQKTVMLTFEAPEQVGNSEMNMFIQNVNGVENASKSFAKTTKLNVVSKVPVNRPLVEEFTGTWCGYCTRGLASLEHMNTNYPDRFIAIAYHRGQTGSADPMESNRAKLPVGPKAYPKCIINRSGDQIDPYTGVVAGTSGSTVSTKVVYGFRDNWLDASDLFTPADVKVHAMWSENGDDILIDSEVMFVTDITGSYGIDYALTADGLTSLAWTQSNSCQNMEILIPEIKQFSKGPKTMTGLVYDDVALVNTVGGVNGSLPSTITTNKIYNHEYTMNAKSIRGATSEELIQDRSKLNIIASVVNKSTGAVLNSYKCRVQSYDPNYVGVDEILSDAEVVDVIYYDLSGKRVVNPANGIYVKVNVYSDGHRTTEKLIVR